jgi:uncharacterized repeat protein (TIGR01451 family)
VDQLKQTLEAILFTCDEPVSLSKLQDLCPETPQVEIKDALGRLRFVGFYLLGGLAATSLQTAVTLGYGGAADAFVAKIVNTTAAAADLSVTKAASPDPVPAGSDVTFAITATNEGPDAAESLALSDDLPAETTFQSVEAPSGWSCTTPPIGSAGSVRCTAPALAAGAADTFTIVVNVNGSVEEGTVISNTATATSSTPDPDPGDNAATATTSVSGT